MMVTAEDLVALVQLAHQIHEQNRSKGFYDDFDPADNKQAAIRVALIGAEVTELLEELRFPEPRQGKTRHSAEVEEAADVFIRLLDYAAARGFAGALVAAVFEKLAYNATRPVKHGKIF